MSVLGIVAEYNPFHNGHKHLIEEANKTDNFSATICVMSGNFLQRGEPALCDKWSRAEMALSCGADLVIELPFFSSARSAYYFARGALQLLYRTGVVTHLAFGSESDNIHILKTIAGIIASEPAPYKSALKYHLTQGLSFPLARSRSIQQFIDSNTEELQNILLGPNNILAIEYLRVIEENKLPLIPISIKRQGSPYHSTELSHFASATAIRNAIINGCTTEELAKFIPPSSINILTREINLGRSPVLPDSLEQAILVKLRTTSVSDLRDIYEISEGLEHRFKEAANSCGTLSELRQNIKSKRYSLTRINRTLLYLLFNLSKNKVCLFDQYGPLYLHILGFSAKGRKILQKIKIKSHIEIFNRGSNMKKAYDREKDNVMGQMIGLDVHTTDAYNLLFPNPAARRGGTDFTTSPIIFSE